MGIAADSLFSVMMSWVRALVSAFWALFSGDRTTALGFLGKNWMVIAAVIIVVGLVIDWLIWLIRWQPYHLWARRLRALLRLDEPDDEEPAKKGRAHAAVMPEKRYARPQELERVEEDRLYPDGYGEEDAFLDEDEEERILMEARARAEAEQAERSRLEQEARAYEAERARLAKEAYEAEQARLAQEAYEAEQARLAQEAYEAEQARLAQEAYEAEQARLAQEEYERQMAEYERQKAQYELELAEYERQKAAYEAQLAAQEMTAAASTLRRRRTASAGKDKEMELTRVQAPVRAPKPQEKKTAAKHPSSARVTKKSMEKQTDAKHDRSDGLLGRVAKMIEPEEEEVIVRKTLPPRVDMNDAFRTAKLPVVTPPKDGRRRKG